MPTTAHFQLEMNPEHSIQKTGATGELVSCRSTPLTGLWHGHFGVALDHGEAIESSVLATGPEHKAYIIIQADPMAYSSPSVRLDYCKDGSDTTWISLAEIYLTSSGPGACQKLELSLPALESQLCKFRILRTDPNEVHCHVVLMRVCDSHCASRVNALADYDFRMRNEVHNFSGTAYTHAMYGPEVQDRENPGIVRSALTAIAEGESQFLALQANRAQSQLLTLEPTPGEAVFNYSMRALGTLLPLKPPDFFARVRSLSKKKPLRILSICAGAARVEEQILDHCTGPVELTLLDASPDLIQRAADRLARSSSGRRIECLVGDVNSGLPGNGLFDVIVCVSALHHVADLELVLSQINQRLTDEGEFWSIGEQIGRNGNRLWPAAYQAANMAFCALPPRLRRNAHTGQVDTILSDHDFSTGCFEGVRSEELESLLEAYLVPDHVYKRNAFLWRLVDATYSDNFVLNQSEDLAHLRALVTAEALHWSCGGRPTELHGVYRKKTLTVRATSDRPANS